MEQTIEQTIGNFFRERRELRQDREAILQVLRNNGYKNTTEESFFDDDVNFFGKPKKYQTRYEFTTPFIDEGNSRYALVPVHMTDEYFGDESEELILVDRAEKKQTVVASSGNRGVHYDGRCKLVPLAMNVTDGKKAIVSYKFILHSDLKNPIKVSEGIWQDYLFRHSENCVTEVDLSKMEEIK